MSEQRIATFVGGLSEADTRRQSQEPIGVGDASHSYSYSYEEIDYDELLEPIRFRFALDRRRFVRTLGVGILVTAIGVPAIAQVGGGGRGRRRGGFFGGAPAALSARFHFADDGSITVFSGKVDGGQGRGVSWPRLRPRSFECR